MSQMEHSAGFRTPLPVAGHQVLAQSSQDSILPGRVGLWIRRIRLQVRPGLRLGGELRLGRIGFMPWLGVGRVGRISRDHGLVTPVRFQTPVLPPWIAPLVVLRPPDRDATGEAPGGNVVAPRDRLPGGLRRRTRRPGRCPALPRRIPFPATLDSDGEPLAAQAEALAPPAPPVRRRSPSSAALKRSVSSAGRTAKHSASARRQKVRPLSPPAPAL